MQKNRIYIGLGIILGLIILVSPFVAAYTNVLDAVFRPFSGVNIGAVYLRYFYFIDAAVYLILFLSIAKFAFAKVYKSSDGKAAPEAKMIAVGVGLALTFAMTVFEMRSGFNIGQLGWFAAMVLFLVLCVFLYTFLSGFFTNEKTGWRTSLALTTIIMYGVLFANFTVLYRWIEVNAPLLMALLTILNVVSFIVLLIEIFGMFGGGDTPATTPQTAPATTPDQNQGNTPAAVTPIPNTITIRVPEARDYPYGTQVNVAFDVTGPGFNNNYDYDIIINGGVFAGRRHNAAGNQVDLMTIDMGRGLTHIGQNSIQIQAYRRGFFGGTDNIIAQSATVSFTVGPAGGGAVPPGAPTDPAIIALLRDLETGINRLDEIYRYETYNFAFLMQLLILRNFVGGVYAPTAAHMRNVAARYFEIQQQQIVINDIITAIRSHPQFGAMNPADLATFHTHYTRYTRLLRGINRFVIESFDAFTRRTGVAPNPGP